MIHTLYLDESGPYDRAGKPCLLGGPLIAGPPDRRRDAAMRDALRGDFPGLPWPLHAAEIVDPLAPLGWRLRGYDLPQPESARIVDAVLGHTLELGSLLVDFEAAWTRPGRVSWDAIKAGDAIKDILRRKHRATWAALSALADARRDRLRERARRILAEGPGGRTPLVATASLSGRTDRGVALTAADRWLRALRATIERACLLLPPGDQLLVHIPRHAKVGDAAAMLSSGVAADVGRPKVFPKIVRGDDPPAGVVLADFVLYPALQELRGAGRQASPYAEVDAAFARAGLRAFTARSPEGGDLPTLTADGVAVDLLRRRRAGEPLSALHPWLPDVKPRWNLQQTQAWLEAP